MDGTAPLQLPSERTVEIVGDDEDITLMAPLRDSGGQWEPHVRTVLERTVRPSWTCLDVGANIGAHTLALAELADRVIAFEANPRTYEHLRRNTVGFKNVSVVHAALWDEPGIVKIAESREFAGGAFVALDDSLDRTHHEHDVGDRIVSFEMTVHDVPAVRLDDWLDGRLVDFAKIDVEGSERRVLEGARRMLERQPILLTEYNLTTSEMLGDEPRDYFDLLVDLYDVRLIEPDGSVSEPLSWHELEGRLNAGKGWEDLLCTPRVEPEVRHPATGTRARLSHQIAEAWRRAGRHASS